MNSDFKYYPVNLPRPLQQGYSVKHAPNMLRTAMADGYTRQRLVNQGAPDTANITILLNAEEYKQFVTWYKADIRSGADWFIMPMLAVDSEIDQDIQYRYVRIQNGVFNAALVTTSAKLRSIYRITMTLDVSNTIVDDGSWDPITPPAGAGGDETAQLIEIPDDQIIDDSEDLGDETAQIDIVETLTN